MGNKHSVHNWKILSVRDGTVIWHCWCGDQQERQVMDTDIEKKECPYCKQQIVITVDEDFGWHRHPAPRQDGKVIVKNGSMVLGDWCDGSGKKPCG